MNGSPYIQKHPWPLIVAHTPWLYVSPFSAHKHCSTKRIQTHHLSQIQPWYKLSSILLCWCCTQILISGKPTPCCQLDHVVSQTYKGSLSTTCSSLKLMRHQYDTNSRYSTNISREKNWMHEHLCMEHEYYVFIGSCSNNATILGPLVGFV